MRPEPFPDLGVIQLIHFRCLAVSRAKSVLCYRTLPLICTSRRAIINQRGGALQTPQEGRQEGRGAVLRTSPCTSYYHQSISEAQTAQQEEGQRRWCATYITCAIINSIEFNYQQEAREKVKSRGGVLYVVRSSVLHSYVKSYIAGGGAVLPCTVMNNYRSTRRTRRVFQLLQGLRYFK
jgi:hypothetical protein